MSELDDYELLAEYARTGSEAAFAALVERHASLVYSVALRLTGNPYNAEEITQAVFIILARKAGSLRRGTILSGWLYQTARFTSANFLKGEFRRQRREQEVYMQSTLNEPDTIAWKEMAPLLDEAMGGLGRTDRDAVVLKFFQNKTAAEVAAALNLSEAAAHKRVSRALEKLRKFFSKRGVVSSAAVIGGVISAKSIQAAPVTLTKSITAAALAKGASAGGSAATLIEGTLKLMAWTKVKSVIVAGAVVIMAAGTGVVATKCVHWARAARYPNIQGAWEGIMPLGGAGVAKGEQTGTSVVLHFFKTNGVYAATADAIELGRKAQPIGLVYDFPTIQLLMGPRTTYQGKFNSRATQINFYGSVVFKRTDKPSAVPERLTDDDIAPRPDSDLQGYWKGSLAAGGHYPGGLGDRQLGDWAGAKDTNADALPVNLKIAEESAGVFRAELDSPMQGALGQSLVVTYNRPRVKLVVASNAGKFEGTINDNNQELTGLWTQGDRSVAASFKRADYQAERTQAALKDYSFKSESDFTGHWKGSWIFAVGKAKVPIRLTLDIAKLPDGSYTGELANVDQFGNEAPIPASDFRLTPAGIRMEWKWVGGAYEGKMEKGKLVGTWLQGGGGFQLVFERDASK